MTDYDYDVIVIGGGINGLTCAAYLARAGLKILLLEARGECGAHADTVEPGIPGFLHNLHATWLITASSPVQVELELDKFGLEYRGTDVIYGKTFEDGKNALMSADPFKTYEYWAKHSTKDAGVIMTAAEYFLPKIVELVDVLHRYMFTAPSQEALIDLAAITDPFFNTISPGATFNEIYAMNGFQATDLLFESEYIKTMLQSLSWIAGLSPIHEMVGSVGTSLIGPLTGPYLPVHLSKGGGHALTHALVKAATSYGVKILPCCPVDQILVEQGEVVGVKLSENAVFPSETIRAKKIVSNLTVVPTFIDLIGESHLSPELAEAIKNFSYEEQNLFGVYYALSGQPQFASADYDDGIQRCCVGYFGGENSVEMKKFAENLVGRRIHDEIIANWFIPTLADPTQAPEGCHTSFVWVDVPPTPKSWIKGPLSGFKDWTRIKSEMADMVTETYEKFAPGFKKLVIEKIVLTPLDMYYNNPSAIKGNWAGGSVIPEQFYEKRPVPGVVKNGAARTFMKNLYLSNSIHPFGMTHLASGYIAACELAEDMGVRDQEWWKELAGMWYLANAATVPLNLGLARATARDADK